ncbi:unnamed protein product [Phaeothamnion confervicola]
MLLAHPVPTTEDEEAEFAGFLAGLLLDHACVPQALSRGVCEIRGGDMSTVNVHRCVRSFCCASQLGFFYALVCVCFLAKFLPSAFRLRNYFSSVLTWQGCLFRACIAESMWKALRVYVLFNSALSILQFHPTSHSAIYKLSVFLSRLVRLDRVLDQFFASRISMRFLIEHYIASHKNREGFSGVIQSECSPAEVAAMAAADTEALCRRHMGVTPEVQVYGSFADTFTFVPTHLYFILGELLKNSLRATVEHARRRATAGVGPAIDLATPDARGRVDGLPPIKVIISRGKEDIAIKVADEGGGIRRSELQHVWSYMYSSAPAPSADQFGGAPLEHMAGRIAMGPASAAAAAGRAREDASSKYAFAGYGMGLPLSRLYAQYFGGTLKLRPMEGFGTDAYLHLNRLRTNSTERKLTSLDVTLKNMRPDGRSQKVRQGSSGVTTVCCVCFEVFCLNARCSPVLEQLVERVPVSECGWQDVFRRVTARLSQHRLAELAYNLCFLPSILFFRLFLFLSLAELPVAAGPLAHRGGRPVARHAVQRGTAAGNAGGIAAREDGGVRCGGGEKRQRCPPATPNSAPSSVAPKIGSADRLASNSGADRRCQKAKSGAGVTMRNGSWLLDGCHYRLEALSHQVKTTPHAVREMERKGKPVEMARRRQFIWRC